MVKRIKSKSCDNKKIIGISLGDPGGIGPEIALSIFNHKVAKEINLILIGNSKVVDEVSKIINIKKNIKIITTPDQYEKGKINLIDIPGEKFVKRKTSKNNGLIAYLSIVKAAELALKKKISAIVTCPISKLGFKKAGINFPGHTELLANLAKVKDFRMLFLSKYFNIILHTIHIPLKKVPQEIKNISLKNTIKIGINFLREKMKIKDPKIFVAGLNPHAGENGILGREEKNYIIPIIEKFQSEININGPFPPDTLFFKALEEKPDLIVALYHDQGLIPLKLLDFRNAVNVTAGLPFVRTSPDHGTAFDIAWKGIADPSNIITAVYYANLLA